MKCRGDLELTPLPASGSDAGTAAVPPPVVLDTVVRWAAANGFVGQYKLGLPSGETGVYSVSIDGRNGDGFTPSDDRFVHIDQYTGNILADIRYAEYKPVAKLMAWGIGLHKGEAGIVNYVFNLAYIALLLFVCVSGVVMWWKRRPAGAGRLVAPPMPEVISLCGKAQCWWRWHFRLPSQWRGSHSFASWQSTCCWCRESHYSNARFPERASPCARSFGRRSPR